MKNNIYHCGEAHTHTYVNKYPHIQIYVYKKIKVPSRYNSNNNIYKKKFYIISWETL